jgi:hypothetical protein
VSRPGGLFTCQATHARSRALRSRCIRTRNGDGGPKKPLSVGARRAVTQASSRWRPFGSNENEPLEALQRHTSRGTFQRQRRSERESSIWRLFESASMIEIRTFGGYPAPRMTWPISHVRETIIEPGRPTGGSQGTPTLSAFHSIASKKLSLPWPKKPLPKLSYER